MNISLCLQRWVAPLSQSLAVSLGLITALPDNAKVLEIGCGSGQAAHYVSTRMNKTAHLYATDAAPGTVQKAEELLKDCANVTVKTEDAHQLSFESNMFDVVFSSLCLHIVSDPIKVLSEAYRVTKPGGLVGFTVFGRRENATFFRVLHDSKDETGLSDPESRSPFHLGQRDATMKRFREIGFDDVHAWYQMVPFEIRTEERYCELIQGFSVFRPLEPEQRDKLLDVIRTKVREVFNANLPVALEAMVITARKPFTDE